MVNGLCVSRFEIEAMKPFISSIHLSFEAEIHTFSCMTYSLSKPNKDLIPSYIACLREGDFKTMQLNFAPATAGDVEKDPDGYLARVWEGKPFSYPFRGKTYEMNDHELLWLQEGKRFLGTIALRYGGDQDLLMNWVGHIGMAIRPALLQKGFAVRGLQVVRKQIIERFQKKNLSRIRVACHPANTSSHKLIRAFGGRPVREDPDWLLFEIDFLRD